MTTTYSATWIIYHTQPHNIWFILFRYGYYGHPYGYYGHHGYYGHFYGAYGHPWYGYHAGVGCRNGYGALVPCAHGR